MCVSPLTIKVCDYRGNRTIQVPCGKCYECLKTKQNDYMVRICEEMMQVPKSCFVTLTYSNDTVPYLVRDGKRFLTVWKDDVKSWIKRFRTNYERDTGVKGIRYFLCSEYGPKTHRPHYHAIFFGLSKVDLELALNDWSSRYGYVLAKDVNYSTGDVQNVARYVSKYACKGVFEDPFCCTPKPSETFSAFLKRLRQELHIPNDCFPYFFQLSNASEILLGLSPIRQVALCGYVFGRGFKAEVCTD